jgi:hypothetical protein
MKKWLPGLFLTLCMTGLVAHQAEALPGDLLYHGGPVLVKANAILIFWGSTFQNPTSPDYAYAQALITFRNQIGTSEWSVLTQYYDVVGGVKQFIQRTNLGAGTPDWFDTSTPPAKVTDADVQAEVNRYLASHAFDASAIYEVFIPSTSYSDDGAGNTSCGGPNLQYCAYHSFYTRSSTLVIYSIQPYPSCSGCQFPGYSATQNQEHLVCTETRDAVTDPGLDAWFDNSGREAAQKCGWTRPLFPPPPPCTPVWSNAQHGCV